MVYKQKEQRMYLKYFKHFDYKKNALAKEIRPCHIYKIAIKHRKSNKM